MLACSKVYTSEARNKTSLEAIERSAKPFPPAAVVNKFEDAAYRRVGHTLVRNFKLVKKIVLLGFEYMAFLSSLTHLTIESKNNMMMSIST